MTCSFLPIRLQSLDRTPFNPQPKLTPNSFSAPLNHLTAFYSLPGMYHSLKLFWSSIVCSLLSASPTRMQPLWESGNVGLWAGMSWSLEHPSACLKFPVQKLLRGAHPWERSSCAHFHRGASEREGQTHLPKGVNKKSRDLNSTTLIP